MLVIPLWSSIPHGVMEQDWGAICNRVQFKAMNLYIDTAPPCVYPGEYAISYRLHTVFPLCPSSAFSAQRLKCLRGLCSWLQSQSKRGFSTNTKQKDPNCYPALHLRNGTSGWRVRRCLMPRLPTGRWVLCQQNFIIYQHTAYHVWNTYEYLRYCSFWQPATVSSVAF